MAGFTMTRDDIIRMAREAGFTLQRDERLFTEMLERFFHLAYAAGAAAEREACAVAGAAAAMAGQDYTGVAAAIRARGNT